MQPLDPLDDVRDARSSFAANPDLKRALLQHTTGVLRRRRRLRRLGLLAGLAACYLAGMATLYWAMPRSSRSRAPVPAEHPRETEQVVAPLAPAPPAVARAPEIDPHLPPSDLEQLAELAGKDQRTVYFRLAGDRYEKAGDVRAALRCYRLALDSASEADLMVSPNDSYLLMVLKNARQREKRDGKNDT